MGFWSQVLGLDKHAAAYNAVLMEHAFQTVAQEDFERIMARFPQVVASGSPGRQWTESLERYVWGSGRLAQLNLFAITMADLQMVPRLPKELWMEVRNPFADAEDSDQNWAKVRLVEADMLKRHGVTIHVPRRSLAEDFFGSNV